MRKALAALIALAGLAHAGSAIAQTTFLIEARTVDPPPPIGPDPAAVTNPIELRIPGHVSSRELVEVGLGPDGTPVRMVATQRLRIEAAGDYSFVVPGPMTKILPGPGTESSPGVRDIGVIWQGFSGGDRVLSAIATLRPAEAAVGLPLRVSVQRRGDSTVVRLENVARRQVTVSSTGATRAAVFEVFERIRRATRIAGRSWSVQGQAGKGLVLDVAAPLRLTGEIEGSRRVAVDGLLGDGRPLERTFVVPGTVAPRLRLRVDLLSPPEILPTRAELARSSRPLVRLQQALGEIATTTAYARFLASPDPTGPSEASFVYRSASPRQAAAPAVAPTRRDDDDDTLAIVLAAALGAAALAGLAVVWARS